MPKRYWRTTKVKTDQEWLLGTQVSISCATIVAEWDDEELLPRVEREIRLVKKWCKHDTSRIRVTIEYLDMK